jgi:hypothetical protein
MNFQKSSIYIFIYFYILMPNLKNIFKVIKILTIIIVLSKNVPILELNVIKLENVYELEMWCCIKILTDFN